MTRQMFVNLPVKDLSETCSHGIVDAKIFIVKRDTHIASALI